MEHDCDVHIYVCESDYCGIHIFNRKTMASTTTVVYDFTSKANFMKWRGILQPAIGKVLPHVKSTVSTMMFCVTIVCHSWLYVAL